MGNLRGALGESPQAPIFSGDFWMFQGEYALDRPEKNCLMTCIRTMDVYHNSSWLSFLVQLALMSFHESCQLLSFFLVDSLLKKRWKSFPTTWRIVPVSKWLVTLFYRPFKPFGRGTTLHRDLLTMVINHLLTGLILQVDSGKLT